MEAVDTAAVSAQAHWQHNKDEQKQIVPPRPVSMFTETVILILTAVILGWLVANDIRNRNRKN